MKKIFLLAITVLVVYGLYYFISPLFIVREVQDDVPTQIDGVTQTPAQVASGFENLSVAEQEEMLRQLFAANQARKESMDDPMDMPEVDIPVAFPVQDTAGHPASGSVRVFDTVDGQVIRFEDFETINGPQLHLYLSKDIAGTDFIDLGPIRGTVGNINYEVPEGVDLSEYKYIMHWCVPFAVLFNYAEIL